MGPKKDKAELKCKNHDRGFCSKGKECSKFHADKVCEDPNCFDDKCKNRHPNPCKFGFRCKFNKQNICIYSQVPNVSHDEKFKTLKTNLTKLWHH